MDGGTGKPRRPNSWQLTDAKARFSELFERALETPQRVSRHGKDAVVVLSARDYARLRQATTKRPGLVAFLSDLNLSELDLGRDEPFDRDLDL
jgi:prevent-host-death family protein